MSVLALRQISKYYGELAALRDVSLEFSEGSFTAIIGRSGCGKSTLLELCNGLLQPEEGTVVAFGEPLDYDNLVALRRKIGYAVQGSGLFPHLSVADNITLVARLAKWPGRQIQHRLEQLLALMQLEPAQMTQYPRQLSGGQQQRVGLCRAMMLRPGLLLLDEPFGAIDPLTRYDIQHQLAALHVAEPTTTILVTHDMAEALQLADRIVIMDQGRLLRIEDTAQLLAEHPGSDPQRLLLALMAEAA